MIKIEKTTVHGLEEAIRGMRNPMNSWNQSDSYNCKEFECISCMRYKDDCNGINIGHFTVGTNDLELMVKLSKAGTDHRKFMRMICVWTDITAPLYWWKEFDTYKVGTVANSCSTMHTIHKKKFELSDFSVEKLYDDEKFFLFEDVIIEVLNHYRDLYIKDGKKQDWEQMIQLLPSSYNQKRTVLLNYEVLANIYKSRKNHKLDEWHDFCDWIKSLPYSEIVTNILEENNE